MTQGKIERWHQTPIDRVLLENYHLSGDLGTQVEAFASVYTHAARQLTRSRPTPTSVAADRANRATSLTKRDRASPNLHSALP